MCWSRRICAILLHRLLLGCAHCHLAESEELSLEAFELGSAGETTQSQGIARTCLLPLIHPGNPLTNYGRRHHHTGRLPEIHIL